MEQNILMNQQLNVLSLNHLKDFQYEIYDYMIKSNKEINKLVKS